jgi:hypothetical protein
LPALKQQYSVRIILLLANPVTFDQLDQTCRFKARFYWSPLILEQPENGGRSIRYARYVTKPFQLNLVGVLVHRALEILAHEGETINASNSDAALVLSTKKWLFYRLQMVWQQIVHRGRSSKE